MSTPTKLTLQWSFAGILLGVILGTSAYASGITYMNEPPPYAILVIAVVVAVHSAVRGAYASGLKDGEEKRATVNAT